MALKSSSPPAIIQFSTAKASTKNRVFMLHNSGSPAQKPASVQIIKYSPISKVFEDQSRGIVCYRDDDSGEIICEGFDEGPRPCLQTPPPAYYTTWNHGSPSTTPRLFSNSERRLMDSPELTRS